MQAVDYRRFINRQLPIRDRACGSKALYVSRREAQCFLRRGGYAGQVPYHCRWCDNWHLGHRCR